MSAPSPVGNANVKQMRCGARDLFKDYKNKKNKNRRKKKQKKKTRGNLCPFAVNAMLKLFVVN